MPRLNSLASVAVTANVTVVGVTETVVATLGGVDVPFATSVVRLFGFVQLTPGTDATSISLGIRRATVAGTLIGERNAETFGAAAAQVRGQLIFTEDSPGDVASQVYVLTATQAGGVADGTALQGYLLALIS